MGNQGIAMKFYNVERWCYLQGLRVLAQMIYHMMQILLGCTIPPAADLRGVTIAHFHGIVIHHRSRIGKGTTVYQHVTLGGRNGQGGPIVGENCILGTGCCILGNVTIGDNVHIGANSVVLNDIPSKCTVVGIPGRIVKREQLKR